MVVRIQLTIRHIRGHSFPIDADVESDVLGLKVQIWELQKIAVEHQYLVFSGKELQDNSKLADNGITDNAVIFLVESNPQVPNQPPQVQLTQVTIPTQPTQCISQIQMSSNPYQCPYQTQPQPQQCYSVNTYEQLDGETFLSEERIQRVVKLRYWVRNYCVLGMIVSGLGMFGCLFNAIPFIMFTLGFIGTRNLNRCLLVFPLLLSMILGFGSCAIGGYLLIKHHEKSELFVMILLVLIGIFHVVAHFCICKLMCRIKHLTTQERWYARLRIRSGGCCCPQ